MPITWLEIWDPAVTTRVDQYGNIEAINSQRTETYSLGICLVPANGIGAALNVSSQHELEITNIAPDFWIASPAEAAGLIVGDRIVSIDSHQTNDLESFRTAISHKRSVEIEVVRGANTLRRTVVMPFDEDYVPFTPKQSLKP
jgi:predicted metalloprotease with PDZ domain